MPAVQVSRLGGPFEMVERDMPQPGPRQLVTLEPPVLLKKGDQIQTICTYQNPGPDTLSFGDCTVNNEMCISIFYRYPAVSTNFNCAK